jgi:type VI secretion system protein ImpJ
MQHSAVHWANGIFLRPHHFQASDRYWNELVSLQQSFDHPVGYGLHSVTISDDALGQGVLEISGLKARWKEGSIVAQEASNVHRISLEPYLDRLQGGQPLTVYLAIPARRDGHANVVPGGANSPPGNARYRERILEVDDESAGGDRQSLRLRELNFRFLFSADDRNGFETLPIARLRRSATGVEQIVVDKEYFPPSLTLQAWPELAAINRRIHDDVVGRLQALGQQIRERRISFSGTSQGDLEKMLMLQSLNEAAGELSCLAFSPGIHPLVAYTALCKIVGRLSVFGNGLTIPELPRYDHDDLAPIFEWARTKIRELIFSLKDDEYHQRFFVGAGNGLRVTLDPEWFGEGWDWFFGVNPINLTRDDCLMLLRSIQFVLGAASEVEELFTKRAPGLSAPRVKQTPSVLPSNGNWLYFQVARDNDAWRKVLAEQTLAMRVQHLKQLEGEKRLKLTYEGNVYALEFAIFAVRRRA